MYKVVLSSKAEKQFSKLTNEMQDRIWNSLNRLKIRPYSFVVSLVGVQFFRLRVGKYRLILDIIKNELVVLVVEIDHRERIYGKI